MSTHKYNTIHYNNILAYLKNNPSSFLSVENISQHFKCQNIKIGTATIYRVLNKLIDENIIKKQVFEKNKEAFYQYISVECMTHYHFRCDICKTLFHIDCDTINNFVSHIKNSHGFSIDLLNSIFKGTCSKCKGEII